MQYVFDAVKLQRVARVGAALEPGYDVVTGGEYVYYLAFSFVAPLEAQQYVGFVFHDRLKPVKKEAKVTNPFDLRFLICDLY